MAKLIPLKENGQEVVGYLFNCPACKSDHWVHVQPHKAPNGASWAFNGDMDYPTFSPSVMVRIDRSDGGNPKICHSFVTEGKIRYLSDCTHSLAGQAVEIPEQ